VLNGDLDTNPSVVPHLLPTGIVRGMKPAGPSFAPPVLVATASKSRTGRPYTLVSRSYFLEWLTIAVLRPRRTGTLPVLPSRYRCPRIAWTRNSLTFVRFGSGREARLTGEIFERLLP
jgi:hypothetical protein